MQQFKSIIEISGYAVEASGVLIIVLGCLLSTLWFLLHLKHNQLINSYNTYRITLGRVILLGLEFLLAGDIIRTVVISPNLQQVGVLAIIVLIRTFLSFTLELEVEGRWLWQKEKTSTL